eukprot:gene17404-23704_t
MAANQSVGGGAKRVQGSRAGIQIKGGVWKNTEDEILKAAVMKYGLNQWARISSLLVRKAAKQCKQRWFEWLDPSIKKTEWTREEDEKLLHLAKLMPCQWRTIAPIVGRTSAQCLERYEKLLDMAVSKEDRYDPADDPRRLRPGEIDPNPETRPARPDAVDMDEDEKEMLSEARARLANTRGKKAKRKAREKQLEEARRLASLQKKRELKAAGIEQRTWKKRGNIDYNTEVAFEKKPAAGFFDTNEEVNRSKELQIEFRPITVEEIEGKRRKDVEENMMKHDLKRQKLQEAKNTPAALAASAERDADAAAMLRRRGAKMMLPAPQVSEMELEQIARMSSDAVLDQSMAEGAGGEATRQLLGEYGSTPLHGPGATPSRTARTAPTGDRLLMEAQNLARLTNMATPLFGGENPDLNPSDFSGVTPRPTVSATPNPLSGMTPGAGPSATPSVLGMTAQRGGTAIAGYAATPSMMGATPGRGGATMGATPMRDQLGLNDMDALVVAGSKRAEAQRQANMRSELRSGLGGLPAPQNEYQIMAPDLPEENGDGTGGIEEDAADRKARLAREQEERRQIEERKKSKALQRHLPRPASLDLMAAPVRASAADKLSLRERAEDELANELLLLLKHDAAKYPVARSDPGEKKKSKKAPQPAAGSIPEILNFEEAEMKAAAALLDSEVAAVRSAMGHGEVGADEYLDAWNHVKNDYLYAPSKGRYNRAASATPQERVESLKVDFDNKRAEMGRESKRAAKIESKVAILVGGLQQRDAKLRSQLEELVGHLQRATVELQCFKALSEQELRAAPDRIENAQKLVEEQSQREIDLQERYKLLTRQRADLMSDLEKPLADLGKPVAELAASS